MTPVVTAARLTSAAHRAQLPLLVLGPALGSTASGSWGACARHLGDVADVVAWDLPGHGHNRAVLEEGTTPADLARGLLAVLDDVLDQRGEHGGSFDHVGVGLGGEVGRQLRRDAPGRVRTALVLDEPEADPSLLAARIRREVWGEEDAIDPASELGWADLELGRRDQLLVALASSVARGDRDGLLAVLPEARTVLTHDELAACLAQSARHLDAPTAAAVLRAAAGALAPDAG